MPLTFFKRENKDIWLALAKSKTGHQNVIQLSSLAQKVEDDLQKNGASFFQEIQERNGLLKSQLEDGLAELVARGLVTSDSFSGLRTLLGRNKRKNRTWSLKKGRKNSISEVEYAGRWSLQDYMRENYQGNEARNRLNKKIHILDEGQLERLIYIYLKRWGVIARSLLEKESLAPPWRELLIQLRKMELQGILRGGRFIAGLSGEQFSLPDTVDEIRKFKKVVEAKERRSFFLHPFVPNQSSLSQKRLNL